MPAPESPREGLGAQDGVELVQRIPLFRALTADETRRLLAIARVESRPAGEAIVEANAMGQALYVVRRGRVRVVRDGATLGQLGEGELFGEMSLVDDLFTSAAVVAETAVELVVLPRHPFEMLVASDLMLAVKIYRAFCRTLSDRLRRANGHLPPEERLRNGMQ
jgi:CRP-like cAMP-binding protein